MTSWRMQLTASALGVIAIVSAMITATPLESEIGIVGRGIDHLGDGEDYRRLSRTERSARVASTTTTLMTTISSTKRNATIVVATSRSPTTTTSTSIGKNRMDEHELAIHDDPGRSEDDETPSNFPSTTTLTTMTRITTTGRATRPTTATTLSPGNGTSAKTLEVENRGVSSTSKTTNDLHRSSRLLVSTLVNEDRASTGRTMGQSIEDKDNTIEDVRAISFQVPPPPSLSSSSSSSSSSNSKEEEIDDDGQGIEKEEGKGEEEGLAEQEGQERDANERSRSMNNLSLTRGKSTKAFYEIKPSIKTEMEGNRADQVAQRATTSSLIVVPVRKFVLPSVDSAFGKFGPYFEDGDHETNVTARIGSTILLDCKIGMLGDKKVTWLQHSKDSLRLLTVGRIPYSVDQRISLNFRYPSNWRLQILYATSRDSGLYKCQVATHPPLVKRINVIVTAPTLTITDDSGRIISKERHLKAGSALILKCEARGVLESRNESVVWTRGDETLTEDVSENRTMEITAGKEILVIISTLVVDRASPRHAGNYSCVVPGKAKTTIAVHVLNGELPAAVHDGNGVSRAVLNLWLIHLTVSYVFSR